MKTFALLMGLVCGALGACTTSMELPKAPEVPQPRPTIEALTLWQWEQPRAQLDEPRFHFKLSQVPVLHVLEALSLTEALGYEADECALQTVSLHVQNMPLSGVVRALERQAGLRIRQDSNHWHVQCASPETRVYNLDYLDLQRSLQDSSSLSSALDRRGQSALTGLSGGVGGNNLAGAGVGTGASSHGDSGNQSRLLLVNQQVHDLWNRLALHLEFLLGDNDGIYSVRRQASTSETEVQNQEATLPTRNDRRTNRSLGSTRSDQTVRTQEQIRLTGRVVVHPESGTVTIRALPEQHELVEQWLGRVQQRVDKQVLVEAVIAEISLNQRHERGIDWTLLKTQGTQLGLNIQGVASESPAFTLSGRRSGLEGDLQGVLRLLEAFGQTRVVSSPRVMTMSQQAAVLKVIDNRVYFTTDTNIH